MRFIGVMIYAKTNLKDSTSNGNALLLSTYVKHVQNVQYNSNIRSMTALPKVSKSRLLI